ncbi:hypothetical protein F511_42365 [Dorcoceras hygrometricum]|uniref:Uncharacterized protein n=1 Tax=Dorcoceras hygrometricum TaxID=472368 RepID=A0A2Z7BLP3_9LAMI|nr:hypothetical protein F511_42365 [Dorcoceras hygrometricum]
MIESGDQLRDQLCVDVLGEAIGFLESALERFVAGDYTSSFGLVGTSSFGLVGTTAFWIREEDSAVSCVSFSCVRDLLLRCEQMLVSVQHCDSLSCRWICSQLLSAVRFNRDLDLVLYYCFPTLRIFPDNKFCRDTLVTVHRTLSSSIADGRQLRLKRLAPTSFTGKLALQRLAAVVLRIRSTTGITAPSSVCTRRAEKFVMNGISSSRLTHRIMVKRLATSPHDPLGITDSACKNQLVMVSVQYGPFNTYIPIRSTTIDSIGYPRKKASGESSTTKHRLLHASGPHPILPPNDPNRVGKRVKVRRLSCIVSMMFRVVRTNQYNQDLGLIHSTNCNHLKSPNEGSSIDHQVTIHLHAQNITMFPTNEMWYFASQMLSSSGVLILILMAQSTRNEFRIHSDY